MSLLLPSLRHNLKRRAPWRVLMSNQSTLAAASAAVPEMEAINILPNPNFEPSPDAPPRPRFPQVDRKEELKRSLDLMNQDVDKFKHDPLSVMRWTMEAFNGKIAMSTSFGIQSAVLLHLATMVKPDIPVVWVDTGYLPKETYQYAEQLREVLNLNLIVKTNEEWSPARMEAVYGKLWEQDDAKSHAFYGRMRKVEPLQAGLDGLKPNPMALLSGLRAAQTKARANMPVVGFQSQRFKVLPLLKMTDDDVEEYMDKYDLPQHPLASQGYVTVGDWHSSRPVQEGEDARNTRFGGKFQECGLHVDESAHEGPDATTSTATPGLKSFEATGSEALNETKVHPETNVAVIFVKKIMEDGSFCRKCNDVSAKIEKDNIGKWLGYTGYADLRDSQSEGLKIAKHFEINTAPFFLVRTKEEELSNSEWKPVRSYLQLKKMLEKAAKQI